MTKTNMLRLALRIGWASFLVAIVAEGCFFSIFARLWQLEFDSSHDWRTAYALGFFMFWLCGAAASALACWLGAAPALRNRPD